MLLPTPTTRHIGALHELTSYNVAVHLCRCSCTLYMQTYYKLPYVDHAIDNPEQRVCEGTCALARLQSFHKSCAGTTQSSSASCDASDWPRPITCYECVCCRWVADVPKLCNGLAELVRDWVVNSVDAVFYWCTPCRHACHSVAGKISLSTGPPAESPSWTAVVTD